MIWMMFAVCMSSTGGRCQVSWQSLDFLSKWSIITVSGNYLAKIWQFWNNKPNVPLFLTAFIPYHCNRLLEIEPLVAILTDTPDTVWCVWLILHYLHDLPFIKKCSCWWVFYTRVNICIMLVLQIHIFKQMQLLKVDKVSEFTRFKSFVAISSGLNQLTL